MENGLLTSAGLGLVLSMRLAAVESFMRRAGSGGRVRAAAFGTGSGGAISSRRGQQ